jgi:uncharacterized oxidoreductase
VNTSGNTVLITGGATGIGLSMAHSLLEAGNDVLICGRREEKLAAARVRLPRLQAMRCDVADAGAREALADWAVDQNVNVLVNNAGTQRVVDFKGGLPALDAGDNEVRINLEAPVYLTARLLPHLLAAGEAAVVNVSSGLGFVPLAIMPVYCATKAALHLFSVSLRRQLEESAVRVFEVIPPMVDTELDRGARAQRGQMRRGIEPGEVARAFMSALAADDLEVPVAGAADLVRAARERFDQAFASMNARR